MPIVRATEHPPIRLEVENLELRRLLLKAGVDAAEHDVAAKVQRVLLEEMHHRVKNLIAMVQAITSLSLRSAISMKDAENTVADRLGALGRVQDLLLDVNWAPASIASVIKTAIEPFAEDAARFVVSTCALDVSPATVLPMGLILNELCTNAVKYGALSVPEGRVHIEANIDEAGERFHLSWVETGGPRVEPPTRRGLGSTLIETAFVSQLDGIAVLEFAQTGLRYRLDTPIAAVSSATGQQAQLR